MKSRDSEVSPVLLEARALSLSYRGVPAFCDVHMVVPEQRITALIGPSGCGKTSFLSCLNRLTDLIPGAQVQGTVRFRGDDILDPRTDVIGLRRRVGMIFQKPNPFPLSIRRNIELALLEHGMHDRAERTHTVERVLREVGLWDEVCDRLGQSAQALSGGQQQRLCIARALALAPDVLLMDEPCSALDPLSSGVVEDLILRLKDRYTVVIVTHNLQQARRIADLTGVFWTEQRCGRLIELGPTEEVFRSPRDPRAAAYVNGLRG